MEYHLLQRSRPWAGWRPLAGVLTLALGWQLVVPVLLVLAFGAGIAVVGGDVTTTDLVDTSDPTPLTLAFLLVAGAAAIPAAAAASVTAEASAVVSTSPSASSVVVAAPRRIVAA